MHTLSYTARFRLDYRRAKRRGLDPARLRRAAELLAAGEPLPPGWHDGPLEGTRPTDLVRSCRPAPGWLLTYRLAAGRVWLVRLEALAPRAATVSPALWMKTLLRSPVKTGLTVILIAAASFLFLYNLLDYAITKRQYENTYAQYHGTVIVQREADPALTTQFTSLFFLSDREANPAYDESYLAYEDYHEPDLTEEEIEAIRALPYISAVSPRYLTGGLSDYQRIDTHSHQIPNAFFPYHERLILEGTYKEKRDVTGFPFPAIVRGEGKYMTLRFSDIRCLAGEEETLKQSVLYIDDKQVNIGAVVIDPEKASGKLQKSLGTVTFYRNNILTTDEVEALEPGARYIIVCRVDTHFKSAHGICREERGGFTTAESPYLDIGDESICGVWPYITSLAGEGTDYLETERFETLRKLIEVTDSDWRTLDVFYAENMSTARRALDGKLLPIQGRLLTEEDVAEKRPVCVIAESFAEAYGLELGDRLPLSLGDKLFEQYAPMGAVASSLQRYADNWTEPLEFEIVGTFAEASLDKLTDAECFWAYGENAVFVPLSFLPVTEEALAAHRFKPSELSFVIGDAGSILSFKEECLPLLAEMGFTTWFYDGGWPAVEEQLTQAGELSLLKLGAFALAAVLALLLTVYLFILRKKKEFAVLRALGCPAGQAKSALLLPLLALAVPAVFLGVAAAVIYTGQTAERNLAEFAALGLRVDASIPLWAVLAGLLGSLAILMGMALLALRRVAKKPPLALLQDSAQRRARAEKAVAEATEVPAFTGLAELPPVRTRPHTGPRHVLRYVFRHLRRTPLKASLSLALALILCFAMGFFTVLRDTYGALYQNIEILPRFINGFSYTKALEVEKSGFVAEGAYYEYVNPLCESNFAPDTLVLTNDLSRVCGAEVTYREGAGPELFGEAKVYCVVSRDLADTLGLELGQRLELTVRDALSAIAEGNPTLGYEELLEIYHDNAVNTTIAGIAEEEGMRVYAPIAMWGVYKPLTGSTLALDYAEYRLLDYHQATAFRSYAGQKAQGSSALFSMDTTEADRIYQTYRLIETLYPIAFAVAILLGGVLPGIVILQSAREAALLRVLGTTKRRTRAMLGLEQVFLCVFGLALAVAALLAVNGAQLRAVAGLLAVYLAAHFAFCVSASGAAAVNVTRRGVLELLQVKE